MDEMGKDGQVRVMTPDGPNWADSPSEPACDVNPKSLTVETIEGIVRREIAEDRRALAARLREEAEACRAKAAMATWSDEAKALRMEAQRWNRLADALEADR